MKRNLFILLFIAIIFCYPMKGLAQTIKVHNDTDTEMLICYTYDKVIHAGVGGTFYNSLYKVKKVMPDTTIRFHFYSDGFIFRHIHKKHLCIPGYPSLKVQSGQTITVSSLQKAIGTLCIPRGFYQLLNDSDQTQEFIYHFTTDGGGASESIRLGSGESKIFEHKGNSLTGHIQIRGHERKEIKSGETWTATELLNTNSK